jgi:hypothetical protein
MVKSLKGELVLELSFPYPQHVFFIFTSTLSGSNGC